MSADHGRSACHCRDRRRRGDPNPRRRIPTHHRRGRFYRADHPRHHGSGFRHRAAEMAASDPGRVRTANRFCASRRNGPRCGPDEVGRADISSDLHAGAKRRKEPEAVEAARRRAAPDSRAALLVFPSLLAIQFAFLLSSRPDSTEHPYLQPPGLHSLNIYHVGIALAAVLAALTVGKSTAPKVVLNLLFAGGLVLFTALGAWSLARTSAPGSDVYPHIDVFVFQQKAARALLHGRNPYAIDDFPDIYADPVTAKPRQEVYGPGMSDGMRCVRLSLPPGEPLSVHDRLCRNGRLPGRPIGCPRALGHADLLHQEHR